jgi:hypothetical protein
MPASSPTAPPPSLPAASSANSPPLRPDTPFNGLPAGGKVAFGGQIRVQNSGGWNATSRGLDGLALDFFVVTCGWLSQQMSNGHETTYYKRGCPRSALIYRPSRLVARSGTNRDYRDGDRGHGTMNLARPTLPNRECGFSAAPQRYRHELVTWAAQHRPDAWVVP